MDEKTTEQKIQEKGLDAPRLTPDDIDAAIKGKTFTNLPSGKCVICEVTLQNGFTVRGESACVSPKNFDQEIGNDIAFKNARDKIWQLEGYLLQEKHPVVSESGENCSEGVPGCCKTLHNSTGSGARKNVKDIKVFGDGDTFKLISKASSANEGWMKSTKAMEIPDVGCVIQVTTQQGDNVAEALTFVPKVRIELINGNKENGRKIVDDTITL